MQLEFRGVVECHHRASEYRLGQKAAYTHPTLSFFATKLKNHASFSRFMSQDNRIRLPSSGAGITTYTEEYKSRFMLSPHQVLVFIGIVVTFVLMLHILA